jgi:hypothetical protein
VKTRERRLRTSGSLVAGVSAMLMAAAVLGLVVARGPALSPGRVAPQDPAFVDTRKSLAGEFRLHGKKVFVVANHFSSKTADDPLFGRVQPPIRASEPARHSQAQAVNDFVDQLVGRRPRHQGDRVGDINRCQRTVRDYERLPQHHAAMIQWAMITLITRRLAHHHNLKPLFTRL